MAKKYIVQDVFIGAGGSYPFVTFDSLKNNYEKITYLTNYRGNVTATGGFQQWDGQKFYYDKSTSSGPDMSQYTFVRPDVKVTAAFPDGSEVVIGEYFSDKQPVTPRYMGSGSDGSGRDFKKYGLPGWEINLKDLSWIMEEVRNRKYTVNPNLTIRTYCRIPFSHSELGSDDTVNESTDWNTNWSQSFKRTAELNVAGPAIYDVGVVINTTSILKSQGAHGIPGMDGDTITVSATVELGWDITSYEVSINSEFSNTKYTNTNVVINTNTNTYTFVWTKKLGAHETTNMYDIRTTTVTVKTKDYLSEGHQVNKNKVYIYYNKIAPEIVSLDCARNPSNPHRVLINYTIRCNQMPTGSFVVVPEWQSFDKYLNPINLESFFSYLIDKDNVIYSITKHPEDEWDFQNGPYQEITGSLEIDTYDFEPKRSYWAKIRISDNWNQTNYRYFNIPCETAFIDFDDDSQHISIGKVGETEGFECQWDVKFTKDVIYLTGCKKMSDAAAAIPYSDTYGIGATTVQQALNWILSRLGG